MPLYGFKKRFAPMVENGLKEHPDPAIPIKRQTIRARRKDGRNAHPGETCYLYTGLRTRQCRKLGTAPCKSVQEITIDWHGINVAGVWLTPRECEAMAQADGFESFLEMKGFFQKEHGDLEHGFDGLLTKW